jgi:hypothetical protein
MAAITQIVREYARMWPREVFYQLGPNASGKGKNVHPYKGLELVNEPGVYVLYREGIPYYVGQATRLRHRLWSHACSPAARYHNFWNHFSAFVIRSPQLRNQVEGILIAAMPTANGAKPRLKRAKVPDLVSRMSRDIYEHQANPKLEFQKLTRRLKKMELLLRTRKRRKAKARR